MRFWMLFATLRLFALEDIVKEAPYGSWKSPITAELIASDAVKLGWVQEVGGSVYYSEMRPKEKGRTALVKDGQTVLPVEYNARTLVHEYGGGSVLAVPGALYFSNYSDQQLYVMKDGISRLTNEKNTRFADGCFDAKRNLLYYVLEIDKVENCLGAVDVKSGKVKKIAEGCDFYASPRVNGSQLAYYCWNNPNMPWDGGELRVAALNDDGTLGKERVVSGGVNESITQLAWGPDGLLYFVSDRSGWWNLYREKDGKIEALCPMEAEFGAPQWVFGETRFDFWGKDKIVCTYADKGIDYLGVLAGGKMARVEVPFTYIRNISVSGNMLYFVGGSATMPASVIKYDLNANTYTVIKKSRDLTLDATYFSIPQTIEFPTTGGKTAHAFFYPPKNPQFKAGAGELPPLLVLSHGGPTAHTTSLFNLEVQYLTSRGIGVVDVNYGGSSNYGRAYRDRLNGNWGIVDVDDCTNAALYLAKEGLADKNRLAIAGGSAGGFTTLACLTFRKDFKVGASYFGVSDLEALVKHTHKFEARYLDKLVGPYPEDRQIYLDRSPIHHVDKIECPIILLQGDEDAIVPPPQSELMYDSLLKRGIPTAYLLFEKEQHGFRQAANIKRAIEAEVYFFSKIFGFTLADQIEPVDIKNYGK